MRVEPGKGCEKSFERTHGLVVYVAVPCLGESFGYERPPGIGVRIQGSQGVGVVAEDLPAAGFLVGVAWRKKI